MLNSFIENLSIILSEGVKSTLNIALILMFLIACIDLVLAYIYEFSNNFSSIMKTFFTKTLRYAFFFAIGNFYVPITDEIVRIVFRIGYLFFPGDKKPNASVNLPDFDSIYNVIYSSVLNIREDWSKVPTYNIGAQLVYLIIFIFAIIIMFFIIKEIMVTYVEFKLIIALGVILLPFNMFEYTRNMGSKLFNALLISSARLMSAIALTGLALRIINANSFSSDGTANVGSAVAWLFLMGIMAYMIMNSKELATMLINGTGASNSARALVGGALSVGIGTATGLVGGTVVNAGALKGAITKGKAAAQGGKSIGGILYAARQGFNEGAEIASNSRIAKLGKKTARGLSNIGAYATGQRGLNNIASDIWGATGGVVGDQIMHDDRKQYQKKERLKLDDLGWEKDYYVAERFKEAVDRVKEDLRNPEDETVTKSQFERYKEAYKSFKKHYNSKDVKEEAYKRAILKDKEREDIRKNKEKYDQEARMKKTVFGEKVEDWNENVERKNFEKEKNENNTN